MKYLAMPGHTAHWLFEDKAMLNIFLGLIFDGKFDIDELKRNIYVNKSLRILLSENGDLLTVWNTEYLSGTDIEKWGIIKIDGEIGLLNEREIFQESFKQAINIIKLRLYDELQLDQKFIHRYSGDNVHTCLAGKSDKAQKHTLVYVESNVPIELKGRAEKIESLPISHSLMVVGPGSRNGNFETVVNAAGKEIQKFQKLVNLANELMITSTKRSRTSIAINRIFDSSIDGTIFSSEELSPGFVKIEPFVTNDKFTGSIYETMGWTLEKWLSSNALNETQRRVLETDIVKKQPIRLIGSAGSGKTLLMELLAIRLLKEAKEEDRDNFRILYVVHSSDMALNAREKLSILGAEEFIAGQSKQKLEVKTLYEYAKEKLKVEERVLLSTDAYDSKQLQLELVKDAIEDTIREYNGEIEDSELLKSLFGKSDIPAIVTEIVSAEIAISIKGHDLTGDPRKYIQSERALSSLHKALNQKERGFIYRIFENYQKMLTDSMNLDSDDVAISFLGHLRTPLWNRMRVKEGYDYIFVDEAQLFNENEKKLFPLFVKGERKTLPIVLALDQAQELQGSMASGLARLGIEGSSEQQLLTVHRCTKEILDLSFHLLQKTTDLFNTDFPDFTHKTKSIVKRDAKLEKKPVIVTDSGESKNIGKFVLKTISEMRKDSLRQVCVIVHAKIYWELIKNELLKERGSDLFILENRGEKIESQQPKVILTRPESVGGQEFDAVISVGLEEGYIPPTVPGQPALNSMLEQRSLREMYLAFTRARFQLCVILSKDAKVTRLLKDAISHGLISYEPAK